MLHVVRHYVPEQQKASRGWTDYPKSFEETEKKAGTSVKEWPKNCKSESCERECSETSMSLFQWGFHLHVYLLHLYFLSLCMCRSHFSECTTLLRIVCIVHRTVTFILVTYKCLRLAGMACAERYGSSCVIICQVISWPLPDTNFYCCHEIMVYIRVDHSRGHLRKVIRGSNCFSWGFLRVR